ncbi:hypothetical protein NDU88_003060 [Pleurodeles waltl]|uniref:Uncharacterized protein n=1 Tax=Pleurodeles waltl TaxID=8319 RepID=A0AAV7NJK0_PLEWA|nr:hypothetical protein NDU88_003060 [Pleurodeles waltl]
MLPGDHLTVGVVHPPASQFRGDSILAHQGGRGGLVAAPKPRNEELGQWVSGRAGDLGQVTAGEYEGGSLETSWLEYDEESFEEEEPREDMGEDEQEWWGDKWGEYLTM